MTGDILVLVLYKASASEWYVALHTCFLCMHVARSHETMHGIGMYAHDFSDLIPDIPEMLERPLVSDMLQDAKTN